MTDVSTEEQLYGLRARAETNDVLVKYCRSVDRCDREIILSVFHEDAVDDMGSFRGTREEFADRVIKLHTEQYVMTAHYVTNTRTIVEVERARGECYMRVV